MSNGVMRESMDEVLPADKFIVGTARALQESSIVTPHSLASQTWEQIRTNSRVRRAPLRFTLLAGATTKKNESLRAVDEVLGSQWYVGDRAGKHPIPQTMREM
jgi:hypothetical protein